MPETITITESELLKRLEDEDTVAETIASLFETDHLSARLVPREHVEIVPDEAHVTKGGVKEKLKEMVMNLLNSRITKSRQDRYRRLIEDQPELPRAVAEGDSWFLHPQIDDVVDQLFGKKNPRVAIFSLAAAGDDLAAMWQQNQYLAAVEKESPNFVLLSGGGNDFLGPVFAGYLNDYTEGEPGKKVERFLNANFERKLVHLKEVYGSMLRELRELNPKMPVVVHGYDYVRPGVEKPDTKAGEHKGKWLGKHLTKFGITNTADRDGLVRFMVDAFNENVLKEVAKSNPNMLYVDVRQSAGSHEWYDEIHPDDKGFNSIVVRISEAIAQLGR